MNVSLLFALGPLLAPVAHIPAAQLRAGIDLAIQELNKLNNMARPLGSQNKDKPFRDALRIELAALGDDDPKALRGLARRLLATAAAADGLAAIKEVADRLDGKPAQALIGGDDDDPAVQLVHRIERAIVRAET